MRKFPISLLSLLFVCQNSGFAQEDESPPEAETDPVSEVLEQDPVLEVLQQDVSPPALGDSVAGPDILNESADVLQSPANQTTADGVVAQEQLEISTLPNNVEELSTEEIQTRFIDEFNEERHREARDLGEVIVRRISRESGREALELVVPLNNLATVYELLSDYDLAEQHYARSINILEKNHGQYHKDLIRPLTGLGITFESAGRHQEAIASFHRAQHLTHRMDGVFTPEQLSLLQRIAGNFVKMNDFGEADRAQRLWFKVNEHNVGRDNVDILPSLYHLAEWYMHSGQYTNAVNAYNRGIDILEDEFGEEDLQLLKPLRGIAEAGGGRARTNTRSIKALERADHILEVNPEADPF
ncbi:MAG: tetratricopeptide repeat protein, partial [Pseudomonadota bacterium]